MCRSEKDAMKLLCRIRDEENGGWTQDAWDAFDMAIEALQNQRKAKRVRRFLLCFVCTCCFFAGLIAFACSGGGNKSMIAIGVILLVVGMLAGDACDDRR